MRWLTCLCVVIAALWSFGRGPVARAQGPVASTSAAASPPSAASSSSSSAPVASAFSSGPSLPPRSDWCAPELEALAKDVCFADGPAAKSGKRTLVIFLHGLVEEGAGWQHTLQRGMVLAGKRLGFSVLTPRGRSGIGPGRKATTIAWPTGEGGRKLEDELLAEWMDAKSFIEQREGFTFDEVFVMGFSNGAYYASSLALRGRLDVDGYGVFAGGSAPKGTVNAARKIKNRRPVFLAIASKDTTTAKKARELGDALKDLSWPHQVASRRVGHVIADAHLERGLEFLRTPTRKASLKTSKSAAEKSATATTKKASKRPSLRAKAKPTANAKGKAKAAGQKKATSKSPPKKKP